MHKALRAYTTSGEVTDLVIMMFSAILSIIFIRLGYVVRPKKVMPPPPKLKKKAVKNVVQARKVSQIFY